MIGLLFFTGSVDLADGSLCTLCVLGTHSTLGIIEERFFIIRFAASRTIVRPRLSLRVNSKVPVVLARGWPELIDSHRRNDARD
jgi:hypothetical protein